MMHHFYVLCIDGIALLLMRAAAKKARTTPENHRQKVHSKIRRAKNGKGEFGCRWARPGPATGRTDEQALHHSLHTTYADALWAG